MNVRPGFAPERAHNRNSAPSIEGALFLFAVLREEQLTWMERRCAPRGTPERFTAATKTRAAAPVAACATFAPNRWL